LSDVTGRGKADNRRVGFLGLRARSSAGVHGMTLRRLLDGAPALDLAASLVVYQRALAALQALHGTGVVHGAISPGVIFVDTAGELTIVRPPATAEPATPLAMASRYTAPERRDGAPASEAGDIFAATEILREALGDGDAAGPSSNDSGQIVSTLAAVPLPARELVGRGLEPDPALRASAAQLQEDAAEAGRAFLGDGWNRRGADALRLLVAELSPQPAPSRLVLAPGHRPWRRQRLAAAGVSVLLLAIAPVIIVQALPAAPSVTGLGSDVSALRTTAPSPTPGQPSTPEATAADPIVAPASPPPGTARPGRTSELTPSPASTSRPTPRPTATPTPTTAPTATPTPTPTATATPTPTATPKPTHTPKPTATPTATP
jgi:serine/threonine protein kinase